MNVDHFCFSVVLGVVFLFILVFVFIYMCVVGNYCFLVLFLCFGVHTRNRMQTPQIKSALWWLAGTLGLYVTSPSMENKSLCVVLLVTFVFTACAYPVGKMTRLLLQLQTSLRSCVTPVLFHLDSAMLRPLLSHYNCNLHPMRER
jgi:hypothetical protein